MRVQVILSMFQGVEDGLRVFSEKAVADAAYIGVCKEMDVPADHPHTDDVDVYYWSDVEVE